MKRAVFVLTALTAGAAFAQSSVTLYGGFAIGLKHQSAKSNSPAGAVNSVANNDAGGNHITWRVVEDLGGGMKAGALINVRFDPSDGSITSTSKFAQNVKLSLGGPFGEIAAGRFNGPVDVLRMALDIYTPYGLGTMVYGAPLDASTRYNGMVQYSIPIIDGLGAAFLIVPKHNMSSTVNTYEAAVKYVAGRLILGAGYTRNAGAGVHASTNVKDKDAITIGAAYNFGNVSAGATHTRVDSFGTTPQSNRTSLGVRMRLADATSLKAGYEHQKSKGRASVNAYAMGAEYSLSKRTMLSAELGKFSSSDPARDDKGVTYVVGLKHSF